MGRAQKYFKRKRFIYGLFFAHGAVYIGQSVDPSRRHKEHLRPEGGWGGAQFRMRVLYEFTGTESDGQHYEQSYRLLAVRKGYKIYGLPLVYVDPWRRATIMQRGDSLRLKWPQDESSGRGIPWLWILTGCVALAALYSLR
jgi:predicted GIY-YIG superfamily endonuclease